MLPLGDIKLGAGQMNQMSRLFICISEIKLCCHTQHSNVSMMAPSSLSKKLVMTPMTDQELDAVTIVFHQFETGLREGTIYTKVRRTLSSQGEVESLSIKSDPLAAEDMSTDLYLLHIYFAKTKLDLNYISINCRHILPTIRPLL